MTGEQHGVPCALVMMVDGRPDEVVVVFPTPGEADEFAQRHSSADYVVVPMRFSVDIDGAQLVDVAAARAGR